VIGSRGIRVLLVALAVVLAPVSLAAAKGSTSRGSLHVRVGGLTRGQKGRLQVTGPHGFRHVVTGRTATFGRLRSGRYRIVAKAFKVGGGTDYASPAKLTAIVRAGRRTVVRLSYGNVISSKTRIAPAAPTKLFGNPQNPSALVLPGGTNVHVGQILYYPPSSTFPIGLFSRVTSVERQGGQVKVTLTDASLDEAFPEIHVSQVIPIGNPPAQASDFESAFSGDPFAKIASGLNFSISHGPIDCGTSVTSPPTLNFPVNLSPALDVQINKPLGGSLSARFVVGLTGSAGIQLSAPEGTGCTAELASLGPYPIGAIPIGPVEIPVTASVKASASLELNGELTANASINLQTQAGFNYAGGHFSSVFSATPSGNATIDSHGGSFKIGPELEVAAGLADALDANVTAGLYDQLKGSSSSSYQFGVQFELEGALEATGVGTLSTSPYDKFFSLSSYGIPPAG
jgi:hypothetical protein